MINVDEILWFVTISQVVGCDRLLNSTKTNDQCGICGGDGMTCQPISGTFVRENLQVGKPVLPDKSLSEPPIPTKKNINQTNNNQN